LYHIYKDKKENCVALLSRVKTLQDKYVGNIVLYRIFDFKRQSKIHFILTLPEILIEIRWVDI